MAVLNATQQDMERLLSHRKWFSEMADRKPFDGKSCLFLFQAELDDFEKFYTEFIFRIGIKVAKKKDKNFVFKGYCNINVLADYMAACENFMVDDNAIWQSYINVLNAGYSFKSYWSEKDGSYRTSLTCMNPEDPNFGYVLSAFAGHPKQAMAVVLFKHFEIAEKDWQSFISEKHSDFG